MQRTALVRFSVEQEQRGRPAVTTTTTPLPESTWRYGGYPYALLPLVLPEPAERSSSGDVHTAAAQLRLLESESSRDDAVPPDSVERLYWFRWIVGNQAASALWQLLDDELGLVLSEELPSAARNAAALLDGYSVLLIYSGTLTRTWYHRLVRPAMALQHRSFSGRWAQDYIPVMAKSQALKSRYRGRQCPEPVAALIRASRLNHRTHVAVAEKLVPGEDSLLRSHDGLASLGAPTEDTVRLYDAFYSTVRRLVPREHVVEQLVHRLRAVMWDVRSNGLYPADSSSEDERPAELWAPDIVALERDFGPVVLRTASAAFATLRPVSAEH
jgi:hypothetical protein